MAYYRRSGGGVPWWLIALGFMFGFWPGAILLGIRLVQEMNAKDNGATRRTDRQWEQNTRAASEWSRNAQDVSYRNVNGQRTYQPPRTQYVSDRVNQRQQQQQQSGQQQSGQMQGVRNADGSYHYVYRQNAGNAPDPNDYRARMERREAQQEYRAARQAQPQKRSLLDNIHLSPKIGKGLKLAGNIILGVGAAISLTVLLGSIGAGEFWEGVLGSTITAIFLCGPGAAMSVVGSRRHDRVMRCRTYAAMIGDLRRIDIDDLAAAIPTSYKKCVEDLNWMMGEGLLKGMYIDGSTRSLTYPDAKEEKAQKKSVVTEMPPVTAEGKEKIYPEEWRIHRLNEEIADEYVSERMDRLESLTHKILAYAEAHPEKEESLRQFKNHYLPKTFNILESYARMERTGVEGGNISSAMKDVEEIMDKLVAGFENQLDSLYDDEALDVTTDISVLENMMKMEGLSDLDPFGSLKKDDDLLTK